MKESSEVAKVDGVAKPIAPAKKSKKKKSKNKTKGLYDLYLADSGSDQSYSAEEEDYVDFLNEEYTVDMDINILINQTVQNIIQSVCLEDFDDLKMFGDAELNCFVAAVKHNSSILSIQIRYLDVGDDSLVPLCRALVNHPRLRALDLTGTHGTDATSRALRQLVCNNSNIIFAKLDSSICNARDCEIIEEACKYNAFVCADPNSNPFHLGLLRKISAIEEKDQKLQEQMRAKPWLLGDHRTNQTEDPVPKKGKKKVTIIASKGNIGAEVCPQFVSGSCAYGSRCKYFHPERTAALRNVSASSQYKADYSVNDGASTAGGLSVLSTTSSLRPRLQSRLRPSHFTYRPERFHKEEEYSEDSGNDSDVDDDGEDTRSGVVMGASVWCAACVVICCCALIVRL